MVEVSRIPSEGSVGPIKRSNRVRISSVSSKLFSLNTNTHSVASMPQPEEIQKKY